MNLRQRFGKQFLLPLICVTGIIAFVFGSYEVIEEYWLAPDSAFIYYLHLFRGIGTSVLVAVFLGWYYLSREIFDLGRKTLTLPTVDSSRTDRQEFYRLFSIWLIRLRWIAIVATGIIIYLFGIEFPVITSRTAVVGLFVTITSLALANFAFFLWNKETENYLVLDTVQMLVDLLALTVLLHFSGGLQNPLYLLFLFHVILGSIVCQPREAIGFACLSSALFVGLVLGKYYGFLAVHPLRFETLWIVSESYSLVGQSPYFVYGRVSAFLLILSGTLGFTLILMGAIRRSRGQLLEATERKDQLLKRVITAQEEERARVARELHDQIGQSLSALQMKIGQLVKKSESDSEALVDLKKDVEDRIEEVRSLSSQIRPPALKERGLPGAVRSHVSELNQQFNAQVDFEHTGLSPQDNFSQAVDLAVYRVIQEAAHNAIVHGNADKISILIHYVNNSIRLSVLDDGEGFDVRKFHEDSEQKFLGIRGMNERIDQVGGDFQIRSTPGQGTRVTATIPQVDEPEEGSDSTLGSDA